MLHRWPRAAIAFLLVLASIGATVPVAVAQDGSSGEAAAQQYLETVPGAGGGRSSKDPAAGTIDTVDAKHCVEQADAGALASIADFGSTPGQSGGTLGIALPAVLALGLIAALIYALGRRRRAAAALSVLCLATLGVPAVAGATVELGIATGGSGSDVLSRTEFERLRLGGAQMVRVSLDWEIVEPQRDGPYINYFDEVIRNASEGALPSVEILPILFASPSWVEGGSSSNEPPRTASDLRAWARFVEAMVERYGPGGHFWIANSDEIDSGALRYNPIRAWQVWNEPNLSPFWTNFDPDAKQYARLLKVTDEAIKRGDPKARTVLAGMLERADAPLPMSKFLAQLYRAGVRKHFDVLAPQPFAFVDDRPAIDASLRRVRKVANRNGDSDKPIWITEFGVASDGPKTKLTTDKQGQASIVRGDVALMRKREKAYGIEKALWFQWRDADSSPPQNKDNKIWQTYTGLFTFEGEPKPSWQAFCALARGTFGDGPLP